MTYSEIKQLGNVPLDYSRLTGMAATTKGIATDTLLLLKSIRESLDVLEIIATRIANYGPHPNAIAPFSQEDEDSYCKAVSRFYCIASKLTNTLNTYEEIARQVEPISNVEYVLGKDCIRADYIALPDPNDSRKCG